MFRTTTTRLTAVAADALAELQFGVEPPASSVPAPVSAEASAAVCSSVLARKTCPRSTAKAPKASAAINAKGMVIAIAPR